MKRFPLCLALGAFAHAVAAAPLDTHYLRLGVGAVKPQDIAATPWLVAALGFRAWVLPLELEVGYWSRSEQAFGLDVSLRDIQLGLIYVRPLVSPGRSLVPFVAFGASAHVIRNAGALAAGERATETELRPGLQLAVGIERNISLNAKLFVAARYDWVFERTAGADRQGRLYGGLRIDF